MSEIQQPASFFIGSIQRRAHRMGFIEGAVLSFVAWCLIGAVLYARHRC